MRKRKENINKERKRKRRRKRKQPLRKNNERRTEWRTKLIKV